MHLLKAICLLGLAKCAKDITIYPVELVQRTHAQKSLRVRSHVKVNAAFGNLVHFLANLLAANLP